MKSEATTIRPRLSLGVQLEKTSLHSLYCVEAELSDVLTACSAVQALAVGKPEGFARLLEERSRSRSFVASRHNYRKSRPSVVLGRKRPASARKPRTAFYVYTITYPY